MKVFDDITVLYPDLQSQVTVSGIFGNADIDLGVGNGLLYQVEAFRCRHLIDVIKSFRHLRRCAGVRVEQHVTHDRVIQSVFSGCRWQLYPSPG